MLLTSAPVAGESVATLPLPLDLHVLSLSLAFILSQDQTLRCCIIVSSFTKRLNENATLDPSHFLALDDSCFIVLYYAFRINGNKFVPVLLYYVNNVANMSKNSFLSHFYAPIEAKSGAKL